jgi:hypothetical protein
MAARTVTMVSFGRNMQEHNMFCLTPVLLWSIREIVTLIEGRTIPLMKTMV